MMMKELISLQRRLEIDDELQKERLFKGVWLFFTHPNRGVWLFKLKGIFRIKKVNEVCKKKLGVKNNPLIRSRLFTMDEDETNRLTSTTMGSRSMPKTYLYFVKSFQ